LKALLCTAHGPVEEGLWSSERWKNGGGTERYWSTSAVWVESGEQKGKGLKEKSVEY
jgi:hypothetical protein